MLSFAGLLLDVQLACLFSSLIMHVITYASYLAYERPGLFPDIFLVFYLYSRVGVIPTILLPVPT